MPCNLWQNNTPRLTLDTFWSVSSKDSVVLYLKLFFMLISLNIKIGNIRLCDQNTCPCNGHLIWNDSLFCLMMSFMIERMTARNDPSTICFSYCHWCLLQCSILVEQSFLSWALRLYDWLITSRQLYCPTTSLYFLNVDANIINRDPIFSVLSSIFITRNRISSGFLRLMIWELFFFLLNWKH